ncbi:hypothetical protein CU044_3389 [Streptomyces sp. L-9-10]|uniref:hypothetical protein n=1 Tax=Streptomyces sp. L-9-10 TaxID=1478131 RepID=UPI0010D1CE48|nr:hypothetical protein [Streptomyces sp. L-9-10]RYJ26895.1 hypothetical protein CU044_3389 [Streptomyces sp. L-9-10]
MNDILEVINNMELPAEETVFTDADAVLATPSAFLGAVAIASALVGAFGVGRG